MALFPAAMAEALKQSGPPNPDHLTGFAERAEGNAEVIERLPEIIESLAFGE